MSKSTSTRRGRPPKRLDERLNEYLDIRLEAMEKQAFKEAAKITGMPFSTWVRSRLRRAAISDLEVVGKLPAFLRANRKEDSE